MIFDRIKTSCNKSLIASRSTCRHNVNSHPVFKVYNKKWIEKQELIAQMALPVTTFCKIPKPINYQC